MRHLKGTSEAGGATGAKKKKKGWSVKGFKIIKVRILVTI